MSPNVNLLAIGVGNSRTRIGGFEDGQLVANHSFSNRQPEVLPEEIERAWRQLRQREGACVLLASSNPPFAQKLVDALGGRLESRILRVEKDLPIPIGRQLDREAIVGEDRLLNAAAAYDVLKQACVVVDAGTAITIDFVDGAGTFHGGAIAPGAQLMLDSLASHTAQLPEIEFDTPVEPIGHNTGEAMRSGAFHGLRGLVREMVEKIAEHAGAFPLVVATGGNSEKLFRDWELVERVSPDLTLLGMAVTLRVALKAESDS